MKVFDIITEADARGLDIGSSVTLEPISSTRASASVMMSKLFIES